MHLRKISSAPHVALESLSLINVPLSIVEMAELNQQQQRRGQRERFFRPRPHVSGDFCIRKFF